MGAGDRSRDLDSRVLPSVNRRLSCLGRGPVRVRWLAGVAVLSVLTVLLTALWAGRGPSGPPSAPLVRVGVVEGQSVAGYVRSTRGELAALLDRSGGPPAETYALVSFTEYLTPPQLPAVLPDARVDQVYLRAPLTGVQTQVLRLGVHRIPEDVTNGMLDAARRREQERSEFVRLGMGLGADADERRLHRAYDTAAQVAAAEAQAYRTGCGCVFAAVVRATPGALRQIAAGRRARAVDPAPEVQRMAEVEFLPPLPEQQTGGTGDGRRSTAPVPPRRSGSPSGAGPPAATGASRPTPVTSDSTVRPAVRVPAPAGASPGDAAGPSAPAPAPAAAPAAGPASRPGDATPSAAPGASRAPAER